MPSTHQKNEVLCLEQNIHYANFEQLKKMFIIHGKIFFFNANTALLLS